MLKVPTAAKQYSQILDDNFQNILALVETVILYELQKSWTLMKPSPSRKTSQKKSGSHARFRDVIRGQRS